MIITIIGMLLLLVVYIFGTNTSDISRDILTAETE